MRGIATKRVTRTGYVVTPQGELAGAPAEHLTRSLRELVDGGARELIVDLSSVRTVGSDAVDRLAPIARVLAEQGGWLLIAARLTHADGYAVRQVEAGRPGSMLGIHVELDRAIRSVLAC
jgi:anti-anti-sigma regulatory factor